KLLWRIASTNPASTAGSVPSRTGVPVEQRLSARCALRAGSAAAARRARRARRRSWFLVSSFVNPHDSALKTRSTLPHIFLASVSTPPAEGLMNVRNYVALLVGLQLLFSLPLAATAPAAPAK